MIIFLLHGNVVECEKMSLRITFYGFESCQNRTTTKFDKWKICFQLEVDCSSVRYQFNQFNTFT